MRKELKNYNQKFRVFGRKKGRKSAKNLNTEILKKYLLNRRNKLRPLYAREISSISVRYDIIHVHMRHNLRYLWFASYFSLIKWKKIFFHDHYGDIKNDKKIDIITKNIIRKSIYLGVSKELCKWAIKHCDVKKNYLLENIIIKEKKILNIP